MRWTLLLLVGCASVSTVGFNLKENTVTVCGRHAGPEDYLEEAAKSCKKQSKPELQSCETRYSGNIQTASGTVRTWSNCCVYGCR